MTGTELTVWILSGLLAVGVGWSRYAKYTTREKMLREFIAMARPYIREPDLAAQLARGRTGRVDCTSCNLCLRHEGHHSLRCWRTPRRRLLEHAIYRAGGGFRRDLPLDQEVVTNA